MSKSFSAKVVSDLLELFGMYTEKNSERMIAGALSKGEKPTPPPKNLKTRFEDNQNGRVFMRMRGAPPETQCFIFTAGRILWTLQDPTGDCWRN